MGVLQTDAFFKNKPLQHLTLLKLQVHFGVTRGERKFEQMMLLAGRKEADLIYDA